jgi:hypothetical protein
VPAKEATAQSINLIEDSKRGNDNSFVGQVCFSEPVEMPCMHQSELSAPECEDSSMTCGGSEQSSFRFERHVAGKMDIKHTNYMS